MNPDNTVAVIGDIHGCFNTLKKIYTRIEGMKIYAVGSIYQSSPEVIVF